MSSSKTPAIGIQLGRTYSCVGVFQHGNLKIIPNDKGFTKTPNFVAFTDSGRLIGDTAKNQLSTNPENTVFDAIRLIGRKFEDPEIQAGMRFWTFKVVNVEGKPKIYVECKGKRKRFKPEEISAMILSKMKETAESYLGQKVIDAVVTVPVYFNKYQRQATKDAGRLAGLNVLKIINEPNAAALAFELEKNVEGWKNVLFFYLCDTFLEVTILKIDELSLFEVISTAHSPNLRGEFIDCIMVGHFRKEFIQKHGRNLHGKYPLMRLQTACEEARRLLYSRTEASIEIDALYKGIDFYSMITRAKFEELCVDFLQSTLKLVENVLKDAKYAKNSIHDVVLIGEYTRIPLIKKMLSDFFNVSELCTFLEPDEAVACGAAVMAADMTRNTGDEIKDDRLVDVSSLPGESDVSSSEKSDVASLSGESQSSRITNGKGCLSEEDIEQCKEEYARQLENVSARYTLLNYGFVTLRDAPVDKLSAADWNKVKQLCVSVIPWLNNNISAETGEMQDKLKEIESEIHPIIVKTFQSGGDNHENTGNSR